MSEQANNNQPVQYTPEDAKKSLETLLAEGRNPNQIWQGVHGENLKMVRGLCGDGVAKATDFLKRRFDAFRQIVETLSEEVAIHRELETHVRLGTVTNEFLGEYLVRIDNFRKGQLEKAGVNLTQQQPQQ
jgi:hypothetical protein